MKINMRKSILLITLAFALAVIMGGAASAATQFNTDVKYYAATTPDADITAGTATPITEFYTGGVVKKVIMVNNTGDTDSNPAITVTDKLDSKMIYGSSTWWTTTAAGAVVAGPASNYVPATGVWDIGAGIGAMGHSNSAAAPPQTANFKQWLVITATLGIVDQDTTLATNTATVTASTPPPNFTGTTTGSAFKILAKNYVTAQKWFASPGFVKVTSAQYNDPVYLVAYVDNVGPSAATGVVLSDSVNFGQLAFDTSKSVLYWATGMASPSTTPVGSAVSVTPFGWTWNAGNIPAGSAYMVAIPYIVKTTNTMITNTFTETQTNFNANPAATNGGKTLVSNEAQLWVNKAADVSIVKKFTNADGAEINFAYYKQPINIVLTVTNAGPDTAINQIVTDIINPTFTIDYANVMTSYDGGLTWKKNDLNVAFVGMLSNTLNWYVSQTQWNILDPTAALPLPVGTAMIKIPVTWTNNGAIPGPSPLVVVNTANVSQGPSATPAPYNPSASLVPPKTISTKWIYLGRAADLGVEKAVDKASPNAGDVVKFTITATSTIFDGLVTSMAAVNAQVTDVLDPAKYNFISASFNNVLNPLVNKYTYDATTGKITWDIGMMMNGAWTQMVVYAQVKNTVSGALTNTANIKGSWQTTIPIINYDAFDPNTANNSATVTMNVGGVTPKPPLTWNTSSTVTGLTAPVYVSFSNVGTVNATGIVTIYNNTSGKWISNPVVTQYGASQMKIQFAKSRIKNNVYTVYVPAGKYTDIYGQTNPAFSFTFTALA